MSGESAPKANKLWGGRFEGGVHPQIDSFTRSFPFDHVLARADLIGCLAHGRMLWEQAVLDDASGEAIVRGLADLLHEIDAGELTPGGDDEDVHTWIERTLTERVGDPARRLHTGRSRNDQTAVALRLFLRARLLEVLDSCLELAGVLRAAAASVTDVVLPGYTHMQRGQPTSLAQHLMAHAWLLEADAQRLRRAHRAAGTSPLGSGALAGTPHPIDPARSAELLGFEDVFPNAMFAVADRDYVLETSFACALAMVHLSRWAEEMILWGTSEFGFLRYDDSIAKGSSIMPQKKNPEPLEILRGKSGRVVGDLVAHLVQLKGLPLTYNSDLQEDKEALFDAVDTLGSSFDTATVVARGLHFQPERMTSALRGGFITATDLADALVRRGVTFRDAHEQTGAAVRLAEQQGCELWELSFERLSPLCPDLVAEDCAQLQPSASLAAHDSAGGPAPVRVQEQLERFDRQIGEITAWRTQQGVVPVLQLLESGALFAAPDSEDGDRR